MTYIIIYEYNPLSATLQHFIFFRSAVENIRISNHSSEMVEQYCIRQLRQ